MRCCHEKVVVAWNSPPKILDFQEFGQKIKRKSESCNVQAKKDQEELLQTG